METLSEERSRREFESANAAFRNNPIIEADGKGFQVCAEANCNAWPQDEQGLPRPVEDRRWWCSKHRHLAGPDDHLPPEPKYAIDPATMSVKAVGAEAERLLEEDRKRERRAAEREKLRREEAERRRQVEVRPPKGLWGFDT